MGILNKLQIDVTSRQLCHNYLGVTEQNYSSVTKKSHVKIVIFIVIVLRGNVVVQLRCSGYTVYRWIQRSVRIKQLQEFLKSDHWLRRYCILFGGVFYFEPPCI